MFWKTMPWALAPAPLTPAGLVRRALARLLRSGAAMLGRWARVLRPVLKRGPVAGQPPVLEFYAEAGAPEGALYVDGEYVGRLEGVTRL